jgi:hypothetical protein
LDFLKRNWPERYDISALGSDDPLGRADCDADVAVVVGRHRAEMEDQVACLDSVDAPIDRHAVANLCCALVREVDSNLLICAQSKP